MISLDIQDYCQDCQKFEPVCEKFYYGYGNCTTYIHCDNRATCANLKQYIEQQITKKEDE